MAGAARCVYCRDGGHCRAAHKYLGPGKYGKCRYDNCGCEGYVSRRARRRVVSKRERDDMVKSAMASRVAA